MRWKPSIILVVIVIFLIYLGVFSCSARRGVLIESEREVLIKSLPKDGSWFTKAKWTALKYGKSYGMRGVYIWSSKEMRINGEILKYEIWYLTGYGDAVTLGKKHGSFYRIIVYNESTNKYYLSDHDFEKLVGERDITKEEAEELAYNFFKELDRYGLE